MGHSKRPAVQHGDGEVGVLDPRVPLKFRPVDGLKQVVRETIEEEARVGDIAPRILTRKVYAASTAAKRRIRPVVDVVTDARGAAP